MVASIMVILILLVVFIRSPWGQSIVVEKAVSYISDKTKTAVSIDRLYLTFTGNLFLEGLYLEDTAGDTLLYSRKLEAGVELVPLIRTGAIHITKLQWEGLKADISRTSLDEAFNYEFLVDAFVTQNEEVVIAQDTTASAPLEITLSPISIKDFDFRFFDEVMGIDASVKLDLLELEVPLLDLGNSKYRISNLLLQNTQINYIQTKPFEPSEEDSVATVLPSLALDHIELSNIAVNYENTVDQQQAGLNIGKFQLQAQEVDLQNQIVRISNIQLQDSEILFHDFGISETVGSEPDPASEPFAWPDWVVQVGTISFVNNDVEYKTADQSTQMGYFNPEVMVLSDFRLEAEKLFLENNKAGLILSDAGFSEAGGFELKNLKLDLAISDSETDVTNLWIETNRSQLNGNVDLTFASIQELIDNPEAINFDISLADTRLDVRDSYFFAPELAYDTLIREIATDPISVRLRANGDLRRMNIPLLNLVWDQTRFNAKGTVSDALDMEQLTFDLPELNLITNRETIYKFVDEASLGFTLPDSINLTANALGKLDDVLANLNLQTELGGILLNGQFQNNGILAFDADLEVDQLQLGALLKSPGLDTLSFKLSANGSGTSLNDLNAELNSSFDRLRINGNDYSGLELTGQMENGKGDLRMCLADEFINFDLLTYVELDSTQIAVDLNLDLEGIDLYELGFASQSSRAKLQLQADFVGTPANFDLTTSMRDAIVVYNQRAYPMGDLDLTARIREDSTSVSIESLLLNGSLRSNTSPDSLITAVTEHFKQHLNKLDSIGVVTGNITMLLDLSINQAPILNQVLLQGLDQLDSARIKVDFSQPEDRLIASVDLPYVKYGSSEVDSLGIRVNSDNENLDLSFGFLAFNSGPLLMDRTYFTGELQQSRLYFDFNSYNGDEKSYHVASDIGYSGDTLSIHVSPKNLLVNSQEWNIPENNLMQFAKQFAHLEEFRFYREDEQLTIRDDLSDYTDDHLALQFDGFRLETFSSLLNPNEIIAGGLVNGRLIVEYPFGATGILGELKVDSLKVLDTQLGNLTLNTTTQTLGDYELELSLKDGGVDLDLEGDFVANAAGGAFDVRLNLNKVDMEVLAGLSRGEIRDASGYLSGLIEVGGTTVEPIYSGDVTFNEAAFNVAQLNADYHFADETIAIDNEGIYLEEFTILDENSNPFKVDGAILTESLINPTFDLRVTAESFSAMNSTREDNDLFFGKGIIDADVTIGGDLFLPKVVANLTIKKGTALTVIIPESQLDIVEREGVVLFVNRSDPYDILTRTAKETTSAFMGYDIRAILQADPEASFSVIVDEQSGDNLLVTGDADLNLEISPNGRITMSGNYEVTGGHYEMSLYNLVSRRFTIAEGSRISWNGEPLDATLAISAIYEIRTSSSELMSSQLSSAAGGSTTQYLQELPFLVYLNVNGELLRPEISFRLDMPEAQRGALGGNVYSRVLQVNEQADELNKQVFSLLVLNRFFPSTGSDGSGGGTEAIARSSASQVLSGQLNALSSKLLGKSGVELDFDLDSFTDYQGNSPQERTQLNVSARKQLFNDRLVVQVGSQVDVEGSAQNSQQGNALIGNVSLEYLLTKNGRYRLRGFQRNEFQSIIDGPLIVTGFGVIFNREFNTFRELWSGSIENQNKLNPIDELEKKNGTKKKDKTEDKIDKLKKEEDDN